MNTEEIQLLTIPLSLLPIYSSKQNISIQFNLIQIILNSLNPYGNNLKAARRESDFTDDGPYKVFPLLQRT